MACKLKITTGQCPYQLSSRLATKSFPIDLFVASDERRRTSSLFTFEFTLQIHLLFFQKKEQDQECLNQLYLTPT